MENKKWIGIDFDGTLAYCDKEPKPDEIGDPIPTMLIFVKKLIAANMRVKIFTARVCQPESIPHIEKWLVKHGIGGLEITNVKDWDCQRIYDDKALMVIKNTGLVVGPTPAEVL